MSRRLFRWSLALVLGASITMGCGDDPPAENTAQDTGGSTDAGGTDTVTGDDTGTTSDGTVSQASLVAVTPEVGLTFGSTASVQVRYLDAGGNAVADAFLSFEIVGGAETAGGSSLQGANVSTNAEGLAETSVLAGDQSVDFVVRASVLDNTEVAPVDIAVSVRDKSEADYIIQVNYYGEATTQTTMNRVRRSLHNVEVLLFTAAGDCQSATPSWDQSVSPVAPDIASTAFKRIVTLNADGTIREDGIPSLPEGIAFTHAIARGEAPGASSPNDPGGYWVTFGCVDNLPARTPGTSTTVTIDMQHLWPDSQGEYEITTNITLTDFIPDGVQGNFALILDVIENPAFGVAQVIARIFLDQEPVRDELDQYIPCEAHAECDALVSTESWEGVCEVVEAAGVDPVCVAHETLDALSVAGLIELFHTCNADDVSTGAKGCNRVGQVVASGPVTDGLFESLNVLLLEALAERVPYGDTVVDIFEGLQDGVANLRNFVLKGQLNITANPDANGQMGTANSLQFNEIEITWTGEDSLGEPVTRARSFNLAQQGRDLIEAQNIPVTVALHDETRDTYIVSLSPFSLEINYGEIIMFAVEAVVLPAVTGCGDSDSGTCIQSFDELLEWGIRGSCTSGLESILGDLGGLSDTFCDTIIAAADTAVEGWLSTLTIGTESVFQMVTPANEPCVIGFPAGGAPPFSIANMGTSDSHCLFAAEVRFDPESQDTESVESTWYATVQE